MYFLNFILTVHYYCKIIKLVHISVINLKCMKTQADLLHYAIDYLALFSVSVCKSQANVSDTLMYL